MIYEIRVKGHLDGNWAEWFAPLIIKNQPDGEATLIGPVRDQAELFGLLLKVENLNLTLLMVRRVEPQA